MACLVFSPSGSLKITILSPGKGIEMQMLNAEVVMGDGKKKNVLVVDDEADIRFLFENILRRRNLQPGSAKNLADASRQVQARKPYLIFLDNSLPDGRGIDFIPYLKRHCPKAKIVVVTANDSPSDQHAAFLQGADDFLSKPLSLDRINKTLDKMIWGTKDSPIL